MSGAKGSSREGILAALSALYERRWLAWYFMQRQVTRSYRSSFLGMLWIFLGPLIMVMLYAAIFSELIGLRNPFRDSGSVANFGLYVYCGLLPYLAFSDALNKGVSSIKSNSGLVQKVVFPLEIIPLSITATAFVNQVFGFGALVFLVALFERQIHWTLLLLPLIALPQLVFLVGLSSLAAVAGAYVPDIKETLRAVVRITFFVTPILWTVDRVPEYLRWVVTYNPLAFLVIGYRDVALEGKLPEAWSFLYFSLFAGAMCVGGLLLFVRVKKRFADLI